MTIHRKEKCGTEPPNRRTDKAVTKATPLISDPLFRHPDGPSEATAGSRESDPSHLALLLCNAVWTTPQLWILMGCEKVSPCFNFLSVMREHM